MPEATPVLYSSVFGLLTALAARSAALLALGWLVAVLLRHAAPPARQALWASVIAGVLLLPLLATVLPAWQVLPPIPWPAARAVPGRLSVDSSFAGGTRVERPAAAKGEFVAASPSTPLPALSGDWRSLALVLWSAGSLLVALHFGLGRWRLRTIRRGARRAGSQIRAESARLALELGVGRSVRVLTADEVASPATWGLVRPVIVLPPVAERWSAERRRLVLAHEMAHVARNDFAWRLLAQLACVAYWFNPLAWVAARRLRLEQELACDLAVVARGASPSAYAHHLLSIARAGRGRALPIVALDMARRSQMEGRLMSILEHRPVRNTRRAVLLPALSILVALPVLAAARTRPSEPALAAPAAPAVSAAPRAPAPAPNPVLAIPAAAPDVAPAPEAPLATPEAPRALEIDPETRRIEEEIALRAEEIVELMAPLHEEIARVMEQRVEPILEQMELVQTEMEPIQEEMSRLGEELSGSLERELETEVEAEELRLKAEALALEAQKQARLSKALAGAEGGERERIERDLRETEERLAPLREEMRRIAERHRASAEEIRARLEPYHAQMETLRERMLPAAEQMERLRTELAPIQQRLEAAREERTLAVGERLEALRLELESLRRELDARRPDEESL